jgi:hypothetical protein
MFQNNIVEKIKTHILCPIFVFKSRAVFDIMWKNIVELLGRPWMTI